VDDATRSGCRSSEPADPARGFTAVAAAVLVVALTAMVTASCSAPEPPAAAAAIGVVPQAVELPSLDVRASVEPVELGADRVLKPPDDPDVLGWWQAGRRPGSQQGSALFTGHTISTGGGALERLEELRIGDPVIVRSDGTAVQFEVVDVEVMTRAELTERAETLFDQDGDARVLLITCEDWDGTDWLSNVVVQAVTP
jgi:LPXTG-site transpeptidase (sortase) family protein